MEASTCVERHAEHLGRGLGVDVDPVAEGPGQDRVARQVGQDPHLDLRVVGGDQQLARPGHEAAADGASQLGPDRDVLQVGVLRRDAPGRGRDLVERGVQAAGAGVDQRRQRVEVGALELDQLAVVEDQADGRVGVDEALEHLGVDRLPGLGLLHPVRGQAELVEQDVAELLGRAEVEALADEARTCAASSSASWAPTSSAQRSTRWAGRP
jgi:hypothetical protein